MLIAFDGIDGSGKNTQVELLYSSLLKDGFKCEILDFGGNPVLKKYISKINKKEIDVPTEIRELIYYFEGLFVSHEIKGKDDKIFIIDRYYLSYLAYGPLNGMKLEEIKYLTQFIPEADLYFYMDIDPCRTYKRIKKYRDIDLPEIGFKDETNGNEKENAFMDFQKKVRENYIQNLNKNHIVIDASLDMNKIHEIVKNTVYNTLQNKLEEQ